MKRNLVRRTAQWGAVVSTTVIGVLLATVGVANAATGTVNTSGSALTLRAGPSSAYDAIGSRSDGQTVTIMCQTSGSSVTGTYGTSSLWDQITGGGFLADAYVYTGSNSQVAPSCVYTSSPPRANANSSNTKTAADKAASYEFSYLGSTSQEGWCLAFQAHAYGWSYAGWTTAEVGGDWIYSHGYMHSSGIPPRGALVWYHNSAGTGHVTLSLGQGLIIGSSVGGQVGVAAYNYMSGYRGWSVPYFPYAG